MNANPDTRASQSAAKAGLSKISAEERQARVALAALYRLVALHGWDDMIFTHISARVPGPEHHFLINPYGWFFDEITASCLVKVDLQGKKVDDDPQPINPAGFTIHSAIHAARASGHDGSSFRNCTHPASMVAFQPGGRSFAPAEGSSGAGRAAPSAFAARAAAIS